MALRLIVVLASLTLSIPQTKAQSLYRSVPGSSVSISGTSTLHDWTMSSTDIRVEANISLDATGTLDTIHSLNMSLKAETLKSGHTAMDRNAYSSLDTENYKNITFTLTSADVDNNNVSGKGNLSVAGVIKAVPIESMCKSTGQNKFSCTGSQKIKMSDFGIEPPSFMFGTVRTGDEITVSYKVDLALRK